MLPRVGQHVDRAAMKDRVAHVLRTYGKTAVLFHSGVFLGTFASSVGAIRYGLDVQKQLERIPFVDASRIDPNAGTLVVAYLATLATGPARGALTITVSPILARWLARARRKV